MMAYFFPPSYHILFMYSMKIISSIVYTTTNTNKIELPEIYYRIILDIPNYYIAKLCLKKNINIKYKQTT